MRILLLTATYSLEEHNDHLSNELAKELVRLGDTVQVVFVDWNGGVERPVQLCQTAGLNVLVVPYWSVKHFGQFVERSTKWLMTSWVARRQMRKLLSGQTYDLLVTFSPACVGAGQILLANRGLCRSSYHVMWDFFPYHHRSIGLIRSKIVFQVALWFEQFLLRKFDTIGCMSERNVAYLKSHFSLRDQQHVEVLPIWCDTSEVAVADRSVVRADFGLPPDRKVVVFGGQLTEGRGLDQILEAAAMAKSEAPELAFLIIGDGRLAAEVETAAEKPGANVIFRRRVARAAYLKLLTACDAGLVCTVKNVDVPTFPSKTLDYLRARLPIVASVEASTDYGDFIESNRLGLSCYDGDGRSLLAVIRTVFADRDLLNEVPSRAMMCLNEHFDVRLAAQKIVARARRGKC